MNDIKKKMLRMFFTLEMIVFSGVYFFGAHGIAHVWRLKKEIAVIDQEIVELTQQTQEIADRLTAWHNHPYYKEKVAREQLQMAQANEEIYYIV